MTSAISDYFKTLSDRFGNAWNRFWFTPSDPITLAVLLVLRDLEKAEASYLQSIDRLARTVAPKLEREKSPLMAAYREKLQLIDAAIE